jgi:hypothetical protein
VREHTRRASNLEERAGPAEQIMGGKSSAGGGYTADVGTVWSRSRDHVSLTFWIAGRVERLRRDDHRLNIRRGFEI